MKLILIGVTILLLAPLLFILRPSSTEEYVDIDYVTDDGFYLRARGINCDQKEILELSMSLSPLRENDYNSCQAVRVTLDLIKPGQWVKEIDYYWDAGKYCNHGDVRHEEVAVELNQHFERGDIESLCNNKKTIAIKLQDYEFISPPESPVGKATSDPLGQQARLDSSIPGTDKLNETHRLEDMFSDKHTVLSIQKRLTLVANYEGPFDGVWNKEMDVQISKILDENLVFFEGIKSQTTLELLGM